MDEPLVDRMATLVRRLAGAGDVADMTREARAIVADLPDPDLRHAKRVIQELSREGYIFANPPQAEKVALAGVKFGRTLPNSPTPE